PANGSWESGVQTLTVDAADVAGNALATLETSLNIRLQFENFQAASVVIGQVDFAANQSNQGGDRSASSISGSYGAPTVADTRLWIPDYGNNRLLGFDGIPEANNANATWVVGAPDFISTAWGTSATRFGGIQQGIEHEDRLYLL